MPWLPLSEVFQSVYFSYYLLLATIPILLWQARDRGQRQPRAPLRGRFSGHRISELAHRGRGDGRVAGVEVRIAADRPCQWRLVPWLMRRPAPVAPAGTTSTADPQFALIPKTEY